MIVKERGCDFRMRDEQACVIESGAPMSPVLVL